MRRRSKRLTESLRPSYTTKHRLRESLAGADWTFLLASCCLVALVVLGIVLLG